MNKFGLVLMLICLLAACISAVGQEQQANPQTSPIVSHGGPPVDYVSLIDNLRAAGLTVEPAGTFTSEFFSGETLVIKVNGEDLQIYEFADADTAKKEAGYVSPDGSEIAVPGGPVTMVSWIATPHFFHTGRLIVQYVGDNLELIDQLESLLGPQFAGGKSQSSRPPTIETPQPVADSPTAEPTPSPAEGLPVTPATPRLARLVDDLRSAGLAVEPGETFPPDIFTVPGHSRLVNGALVVVYEYGDPDLAAAETAWVSEDGSELSFPDPNNPGQMLTLGPAPKF